MAIATRAQLVTMLQDMAAVYERSRLDLTGVGGIWQRIGTGQDDARGEYSAEVSASLLNYREIHTALKGAGTGVVNQQLNEWMMFIDSPFIDSSAAQLAEFYEWMIENSETILSRDLAYGTPTALAGNTGDGEVIRFTVDRNGFDIENAVTDTWRLRCIDDQNTGRERSDELFRLTLEQTNRDFSEKVNQEMRTVDPESGQGSFILENPSFDSTINAAAVAPARPIPGWDITAGVIGSFSLDPTNIYLPLKRDTDTKSSLKITASATIQQQPRDFGKQWTRELPYVMQIAFNSSENTATGTLTISIGSTTTNVLVNGLVGWQVLRVAPGQQSWLDAFDSGDLEISVQWAQTGGTGILIDDFIIAPAQLEAGRVPIVIIPGRTSFLNEDEWGWADVPIHDDSIIQRMIAFYYPGVYLPHSMAPTIADPVL